MPTTRRRRSVDHARAVATAGAVVWLAGCGLLPSAGPEDTAQQPAADVTPTPSAPTRDPSTLPSFDPSSAVAQYAAGFPTELLRAPDGATVLASSASPADGRYVDFSLNLATSASTQEVVDGYADRLEKAGFDESESVDASGLSAQTAYTRTRATKEPRVETVIIGVLDAGERRLVSLSGIVRGPDD